jgi:citrate lyase beta subunit
MQYLKLGASLYVPSTRNDLIDIALGRKLPEAKSIIFCTEDSILDADVPAALRNLSEMLETLPARNSGECPANRLLFIRARNVEMLGHLLRIPHIQRITGFVLPKLTAKNFPDYVAQFAANGQVLKNFFLMPTLETREAFDPEAMRELRDLLNQPEIKDAILALRIGGNDLLNLLGVRRSRYRTLYESALGPTIANLVTIFKPYGFNLTSPVCEFLYDHEILEREVAQDIEYGLFGKTAIHPDQIPIIEKAYQPSDQDVNMAEALLQDDAPAVFNMCGTMCEVQTHSAWAEHILARQNIYGAYGRMKSKR